MEAIAIIAAVLGGLALILIGLRIRKVRRDRRRNQPTWIKPGVSPADEMFRGPYDWSSRPTVGRIGGMDLVATGPPVQRQLTETEYEEALGRNGSE